MTDDGGRDCSGPAERRTDQIGLRRKSPCDLSRPLAMTESGSVKGKYAILLSQPINQAAAVEIFDHAAVAVQEDDHRSAAALDVVQPHSVNLKKASLGRVEPL